ncbi:hypothetical protein MNB_SUP05-SYMBIONT-5-1158 [hydrothermal vent metagenome]|uniref:Uncharacterized protein n=1 Tax=hydrothermal vent metagenome TaxID=652676 RepID=A0A1W1E0Z3_9ZZZZ
MMSFLMSLPIGHHSSFSSLSIGHQISCITFLIGLMMNVFIDHPVSFISGFIIMSNSEPF